jgi:cytochrome c-type biogenesis protein CcmH
MKRFVFRFPLVVLLLFLLIAALPVLAQDGAPSDDEVNDVARDIYCPVCESTPLDVCGTQACADWRELIRVKLDEGQSKEEIFDYFARQYGDGVLANPPREGVNLIILWVLPVVLVLLGALVFSRFMRNLRTESTAMGASDVTAVATPAPPPTAKTTSNDDYITRVEEELQKGK